MKGRANKFTLFHPSQNQGCKSEHGSVNGTLEGKMVITYQKRDQRVKKWA